MNYINLILIFSSLLYILYWALLLGNIRRNALSLSEFIIKILSFIPFWALFIYMTSIVWIPQVRELIHKPDFVQKIQIGNNTRSEKDFRFFIYNQSHKHWRTAYPLGKPMLTNKFDFEARELRTFYFPIYKNINQDAIYIEYLKKEANPKSKKTNAKAISIPSEPIKIFSSEFRDAEINKITVDYSDEWQHLILYFLAIIGIWYHPFIMNKKRTKYIFLSIASLLTLLSGYMLFEISFTLFW